MVMCISQKFCLHVAVVLFCYNVMLFRSENNQYHVGCSTEGALDEAGAGDAGLALPLGGEAGLLGCAFSFLSVVGFSFLFPLAAEGEALEGESLGVGLGAFSRLRTLGTGAVLEFEEPDALRCFVGVGALPVTGAAGWETGAAALVEDDEAGNLSGSAAG